MSGDVQPRKRKDKKKKKDDLGVEEPRGTAAVFGEGDVFMHSYHDHGTGGHWCAKIIFFSLLAVLVTLIGLIILENRGLTELEANAVESRYSGVLDGWLEDAPDDDHHDEHTLELKHHDDDEDDLHGDDLEHDDHDDEHSLEGDDDHEHSPEEHEDEHPDEDDNDDQDNDEDDGLEQDDDDDDDNLQDEDDSKLDDNNQEDENDSQLQEDDQNESDEAQDDDDDDEDQNVETAEDDEDDNDSIEKQEDDDDLQDVDENDQNLDEHEDIANDNSDENQEDDDDDREDEDNDEDEEEHEEPEEQDSDVEVEHIEKEVTDDDVSAEENLSVAKDDEDSQEISNEATNMNLEDDDVEFLEPDDLDDELPEVLPIPVPTGKPLAEFEETTSTEKPHDTLAEEEEYEKQQEELRKEKEQASHGLWLKLTVGGALLVATHAVLRRAAAPQQSDRSREETPLADRRMTLIAEPPTPIVPAPKTVPEVSCSVKEEFLSKTVPSVAQSPPTKEEIEEEEAEDEEEEIIEPEEEVVELEVQPAQGKSAIDMELYSDEEEVEEEEIEEKKEVPKQFVPPREAPKQTVPVVQKEPTPEPEPEEEDDDVEIIDEEMIEEELEEEEEEDVSDVDDAELLSRLEAKYGRLPEPERPGRKDGGNSIEDEWPGEPSDPYWQDQLDRAQRELKEGEWSAAVGRVSMPALSGSARARYILAKALDATAEAKRDNAILTKAIAAYLELLKMNERLSDKKLLEVTDRALDRLKFRGNYLGAEPVYRLLIKRFPNDPHYRNNLTVSFLMANRADLAEKVLSETLKLWPDDRVALAHLGFVLKTKDNKLEEAVSALSRALEGDVGPACEPRFYYHLGDALLLLGRGEEARAVHERAAARGHFLSHVQRSLYNVPRLQSRPWWDVRQTPYAALAAALENNWKEILKEGEAAEKLYEEEKEGLRERGHWSQLDLFVRGREVPGRCARAPVTCSVVRAMSCRRGQVKFSAMRAGTHVRPHVGPTNCRLRIHLGLKNTHNTFIRVDQEIRQWHVGKVLMFDDSFEHEVWHNGTGTRLVLIVDVWHPDLTPHERRTLPAI